MKRKTFLLFAFLLTSAPHLLKAADNEYFKYIAYRIAGRAEIIRERVESIYDDPSTKSPDLYYFIINSLYDSYGLYALGDSKSAGTKIFLLDMITYDLICSGVSTAVDLNQAVRALQKSAQAGSLTQFQKIVSDRLGIISRRGLLESVRFNETEELYFSALTHRLYALSREIPAVSKPNNLLPFFEKYGLIDKKHVRFAFPASLEVPVTGFVFGVKLDTGGAMLPQLYFKSPELSKEIVMLAIFNLLAFQEGFGVNNNDTLESQIHYVLLQMRMCDWLVQKYMQLKLTDVEHLREWRTWYQSAYERLVQETFAPGYYEQLFSIKASPSRKRVEYDWNVSATNKDSVNAPSADDYIFHMIGNGSQMTPDERLVVFLEAHKDDIVPGYAFDLGSGDGRNSLYLAGNDKFSRVIAIDHSQTAVNRIKQLNALEKSAEKIQPVRQNILEYPYPSERTPVLQRASFILISDVIGYLTSNERASLFSNLKGAMREGGFMFIEYHLAEGEKYESLKVADSFTVTDNHVVISKTPFCGEQKKQFFTRNQVIGELSSAGIVNGEQFELETAIHGNRDGFVSETIIIRKKQ
ncbi:MAG: class I SAM-dependent methyltransferase [Candidatus Auribacterota bacterium]|nr:class I SAM-dependent methyltransferase [Candidatus Auribacterota bacterium]